MTPIDAVLVVAALIGGSLASGIGAFMTYKFGQRAVRDQAQAQVATAQAQRDAATAQTAALDAAKQLVEVAKTTTPLLQEISATGKATHNLVNNDRSIDKTYIAKLTRVIAKLLPDDPDAKAAAVEAQNEADRLPKPIDKK
jgi:type II secretory pathway pseudopilin PulG